MLVITNANNVVSGNTIAINITNVVLTCFLARTLSPTANEAANLLRNPLPKPMSKWSIHSSTELTVNQIP